MSALSLQVRLCELAVLELQLTPAQWLRVHDVDLTEWRREVFGHLREAYGQWKQVGIRVIIEVSGPVIT